MTWAQFKQRLEEEGVTDEMEFDEALLSWKDDDDCGPYSFALEIKNKRFKLWNT